MTLCELTIFTAAATISAQVRLVGKTKYLNNAGRRRDSIDDSTKYVTCPIDAIDKYGIKSTMFVSTEPDPAPEDRFFTQLQIRGLWPRLRQAIANGHEIGSHSRQHPCKKPHDETFCAAAYRDYEIAGSRDDICASPSSRMFGHGVILRELCQITFIQKRIAAAGYIVARKYPDEAHDGHLRPDVQDFDENTMNAGYTQVVQHRGMAKNDPIDMGAINAKFDEVYGKGRGVPLHVAPAMARLRLESASMNLTSGMWAAAATSGMCRWVRCMLSAPFAIARR